MISSYRGSILLLLLVMLIASPAVFGQKKNPLQGVVTYQIITEDRSIETRLYFTVDESLFVISDKDMKSLESQYPSGKVETGNSKIYNIKVADGQDLYVYKNAHTERMNSRELVLDGKKALVKDSIPELAWQVLPEKKKILGLECQKATTEFRCSTYEAWFAANIPVSAGPWKMGGLPGLILELNNTTKEIKYVAFELSYPAVKGFPKTLDPLRPSEPQFTFAEFAVIQRKAISKLQMFMMGQSSDQETGEGTFSNNFPECY